MMALALDDMPPEQRPDFSLPGILKMLYDRYIAGDETLGNPDMPVLYFGLGNMWFAAKNYASVEEIHNDAVFRSNWERLIDAADRHNAPRQFTALIGWEYSPQPDGKNLHRVVLTPVGASAVKHIFPYSANDSENPEDLWPWLARTRARTGIDFLAIPHNSNLSKGSMFTRATTSGEPMRREVYASTGPRISVRFFAGYGKGVPMGSNLAAADRAPSFLIHALKDPNGANLDRLLPARAADPYAAELAVRFGCHENRAAGRVS